MSQTKACYRPGSMLVELPGITSGAFFRQYSRNDVIQRPESYIDGHADYVHEHYHHMQMVGTGYGRFETANRVYQNSLIPDLVREIGRTKIEAWSTPPSLPLQRWFTICENIRDVLPVEYSDNLGHWQSVELTLSVLRGDRNVGSEETTACTTLLGRRPLEQPVWRCSAGHDHVVGARAIIEAGAEISEYHARNSMRATCVQRMIMRQTIMESGISSAEMVFDGVREYFDKESSYFFPLQDCLTLLPEYIIGQRLPYLSKSQRLWIAPAIFDLALATPINWMPNPASQDGQDWEDIHPGHRFLAIVELLGTLGKTDPLLQLGAPHSNLAKWVCNRLDWPTPLDLATDVLKQIRIIEPLQEFFRRASEVRLEFPDTFTQPYYDPDSLDCIRAFGCVPHIVFSDRYLAIPTTSEGNIEMLSKLAWVEGFFDHLIRSKRPVCAFKSLGKDCGLKKSSSCDDCLRSDAMIDCSVASDKYSRQLGPRWKWIRKAYQRAQILNKA